MPGYISPSCRLFPVIFFYFETFSNIAGYYSGSEDYYTHFTCDGDHTAPERDGGYAEEVCGYDLRDGEVPVKTETGKYSTQLFTDRAINLIKNRDITRVCNVCNLVSRSVNAEVIHCQLKASSFWTVGSVRMNRSLYFTSFSVSCDLLT